MAIVRSLLQIEGRDGLLIACGLTTGARISEILGFRFIDFYEMSNPPKIRSRIRFECPKQSKKRGKAMYREVPMPPELAPMAEKFWAAEGNPTLDRHIFLPDRRRVEGEPLKKGGADQIIKKHLIAAGVPRGNASSHSLRKTFTRAYYESALRAGKDALMLTCAMLGHADPKTTMRYIGVSKEEIEAQFKGVYSVEYLPLKGKVESGEVNLKEMFAEAKAKFPLGPPHHWRAEMKAKLAKYDPIEVKDVLRLTFDLLMLTA